ncbi:MAG: DNA adenine methylase [Candidatus Kariarchaeaceae archaeon]
MKPLIKWPGGKSREIPIIIENVPKFSRYFEPFFGGGAIFFKIMPENAHVNDIDKQLIQFYNSIKDQSSSFFNGLSALNSDWKTLEQISACFQQFFIELFTLIMKDKTRKKSEIYSDVNDNLFNKHICMSIVQNLNEIDIHTFTNYLIQSICSKSWRIYQLQIKHDRIFSPTEMTNHLETAVKSAYYTYVRDEHFNKTTDISSATFYFIREFCYGSMFRFNKKGDFNIPYGGINYNRKNFNAKISQLCNNRVIEVFKGLKFYNQDFISFFDNFQLKHNDFIFLDPPYDSDFKDYGKYPFTRKDQERLATYLSTCQSQWLLVIQENPFILNLYEGVRKQNPDVTINTYEKQYTYNVRGRNERNKSHLLIKNY